MNGSATTQSTNNFTVFLLGAILNLLAAIDYHSLMDYSVKAVVGGLIWLAFKIIGEMITLKMNQKKKDEGNKNV